MDPALALVLATVEALVAPGSTPVVSPGPGPVRASVVALDAWPVLDALAAAGPAAVSPGSVAPLPLDLVGDVIRVLEAINAFLSRILRIVNLVYEIVSKIRWIVGG